MLLNSIERCQGSRQRRFVDSLAGRRKVIDEDTDALQRCLAGAWHKIGVANGAPVFGQGPSDGDENNA
eukprot:9486753-Pyramimonas_sp.AAC.1